MKYGFIRDHQRFPVSGLCALLGVSKSGFHGWLNRRVCARIQIDNCWSRFAAFMSNTVKPMAP